MQRWDRLKEQEVNISKLPCFGFVMKAQLSQLLNYTTSNIQYFIQSNLHTIHIPSWAFLSIYDAMSFMYLDQALALCKARSTPACRRDKILSISSGVSFSANVVLCHKFLNLKVLNSQQLSYQSFNYFKFQIVSCSNHSEVYIMTSFLFWFFFWFVKIIILFLSHTIFLIWRSLL